MVLACNPRVRSPSAKSRKPPIVTSGEPTSNLDTSSASDITARSSASMVLDARAANASNRSSLWLATMVRTIAAVPRVMASSMVNVATAMKYGNRPRSTGRREFRIVELTPPTPRLGISMPGLASCAPAISAGVRDPWDRDNATGPRRGRFGNSPESNCGTEVAWPYRGVHL